MYEWVWSVRVNIISIQGCLGVHCGDVILEFCYSDIVFMCFSRFMILYVYVIAREGVKFGINFTSCSENNNEIARGATKCYFAVIDTSGIYPKISLLHRWRLTQFPAV